MAKAKRKYSITEMRLALEAAGPSVTAIARELNCSTGTIYTYLKRYPEFKATFEAAKGGVVEEKPKYPKELFIEAINKSHGVKAAVAAGVGCSRQTVDNYLERWPDLRELMDAARSSLVSRATSALVAEIDNPKSEGHTRAYMFVLKTLGKDEGFVERSEVTGADGAALLDVPPDVLNQIKEAGLNVADVLKNFADMVRAGAV